MRYSSTAVDFPIATDVSQLERASYTTFSSRTCEHVRTRTRGHDKNDTLTIQIMVEIKVTLSVHKDRCSDFDKYLNDMVWGLRHTAQVDNVVWIEKHTMIIALSVEDRDDKWGVLSELLTWIYCELYGDVFDLIELKSQ